MPNPQQLAAALGRNGDTETGHLTPQEIVVPVPVQQANPELIAMLLKAIQEEGGDPGQYVVGGTDDSVNPATGMPEYAWNEESQVDDGTSGGGYSTDQGGYGGDQGAGQGFAGSPEVGPNHAQQVNAAFNGEPNTYGGGPEEIGNGFLSFMGVSPARYNNPMRSETTEYGFGFNPGRAIGGLAGGLLGGPLGGIAGSWAGGKMAKTRFGGFGYGDDPEYDERPEHEGENNVMLARILANG